MLIRTTRDDLERHDALRRLLKQQSITLSSIARQAGCTPGFVTLVSQGKRKNSDVAKLLCTPLGVEPRELWPRLYGNQSAEVGDAIPQN